jgi:hypothetical protein
MKFVRAFLIVIGTISVIIGLAYILWPAEGAALADLKLSSPTAVIEVHGFYGGQLVGLGVAILVGAWKQRFVIPALVLIAASLGGTAVGRLSGVIAEGVFPPIVAGLLLVEVVTAAAAGVFLRYELARAPAPN